MTTIYNISARSHYGQSCSDSSSWQPRYFRACTHSTSGRTGVYRCFYINPQCLGHKFIIKRMRQFPSQRFLPLSCKHDEVDGKTIISEEAEEKDTSIHGGLKALDMYFDKLHGNGKSTQRSSIGPNYSENRSSVSNNEIIGQNPSQGLNALDAYFEKLRVPPIGTVVEKDKQLREKDQVSVTQVKDVREEELLNILKELEGALKRNVPVEAPSKRTNQDDGILKERLQRASYAVNALVALNIAIYLFGLASPQEIPGIGDASLPFLYGAKVNELILDGQWWRLITPMFLHSSLLHIGLGSWALLTLGPQVEYVYGPIGFFMVYFLGGIFGNLFSFLHSTGAAVGGTAPVFALVGAWIAFLVKNQRMFGRNFNSELLQKILTVAAIFVALSDSPPIDEWSHIGAMVSGGIFGMLVAPAIEQNMSLKSEEDEILLLNGTPDAVKLVVAFTICIAIYLCLCQFGIPAATEMLMVYIRTDF